jgi:AcrR family transcriptional regulator
MATNIRALSSNKQLVEMQRLRIADAATILFLRNGYKNTTIDDIAERCKMGKGTIYRYIGTKEDILSIFLDIEVKRRKEFEEQIAAVAQRHPIAEALQIAIKEWFLLTATHKNLVVFWYREAVHMPMDKINALIDVEKGSMKIFIDLLQRGQQTGDFREFDTEIIAHWICISSDMWRLRAWGFRQYEFDVVCDEIVNALMHGIVNTDKA